MLTKSFANQVSFISTDFAIPFELSLYTFFLRKILVFFGKSTRS